MLSLRACFSSNDDSNLPAMVFSPLSASLVPVSHGPTPVLGASTLRLCSVFFEFGSSTTSR